MSAVLDNFMGKIAADGSGLNGYTSIIRFNFTDTEEHYNVMFQGNTAQIVTEAEDPACIVLISTENFGKLTAGKLNPQMAFITGKIKAKGDINQLLKLSNILQYYQ